MLPVEDYFRTFPKNALRNAKQGAKVPVFLSCDSRAQVDDLVARATTDGGTIPREPQDHDFRYEHALEDLDGHLWELICREPDANGQV